MSCLRRLCNPGRSWENIILNFSESRMAGRESKSSKICVLKSISIWDCHWQSLNGTTFEELLSVIWVWNFEASRVYTTSTSLTDRLDFIWIFMSFSWIFSKDEDVLLANVYYCSLIFLSLAFSWDANIFSCLSSGIYTEDLSREHRKPLGRKFSEKWSLIIRSNYLSL